MTENGLVPIIEVETNTLVLAYNEETGEIGYYPVTAVWEHVDPVIVTLKIDGEQIETTPEHPFYTSDGEWVAAGQLLVGHEVRTAGWDPDTIEGISFAANPHSMYNFTVATAHTYFVSDGQWLVHNSCNPLDGLPGVGSAKKLDALHAFPEIVDNYAVDAQHFSLRSGADLYQLPGSYSYYNRAGQWVTSGGVFEWIVSQGQVTHRVFVPGGTVNGVSSKPVAIRR